MQAFVLIDGRIEETSSIDELRAAVKSGRKLWVDLDRHSDDIDRLLCDDFQIHPLVVEDIWSERSIPKIDTFDRYLYIVAHGVTAVSTPENLGLWVLDLVVGENFVVTQHHNPTPRETLAPIIAKLPRLLARGTPWVAHAILDSLVDRFLPLVERIGTRIEKLEEDVFRQVGTRKEAHGLGQAIFAVKRSIQRVSRITTHQRAILQKLATGDFTAIPKDAVPYFRDVAEHFVRVADQTDTQRDNAHNAMDALLSMQSNRLNETMKTLTLMSTTMLPLTFIASVYGMNFKHMPELQWEFGYPGALALMALVATLVLAIFKRKGLL